MKIYPDAKVLLTVRDQPESWVKSVGATIHRISVLSQKFETRLVFYCLIGLLGPFIITKVIFFKNGPAIASIIWDYVFNLLMTSQVLFLHPTYFI